MNFKNYQSQIKELIALRNEPDFNELLNKLLFGESNSDKFLIKMELNRLAKPCQRIIDLRDKVTEDCQLFQQDKLKHYLTKETIKVLQDNIKLYGLYTIGVFEAVHADLALQKKQQRKKQLSVVEMPSGQNQCEFIQLSQKNKRGAPRMFFVSDLTITLENGKIIEAQTSNISMTGIKVKIQEDIHTLDQQLILVSFTGLNNEYHQSLLDNKIKYQLVKQEHDASIHYFYLSYVDSNKEFSKFISEFIRSNQYKYKIDVHYYYQLAKASALKHLYLSQMNILPVYLDKRISSPYLFALKNEANKEILNEWSCEGINQLPLLFNELRFTQLIAYAKKNESTTLYCFTHVDNEKNYFISATEDELIEKGLKNVFINYGSTKTNWRIYHLTIQAYQYQQQQSYSITETVPEKVSQITHIATLQPLNLPLAFPAKGVIKNSDLNQINQFVHRDDQDSNAPTFILFSDENRKEERYLYSSKLLISNKEDQFNGEIIDFSFSGLKIKLEQLTHLPPSSKVTVNLSALQKISKKHPLTNLNYKVIRSGPNNTLHLQVCDLKTLNICNDFFLLLVENNPSHFKCVPLKSKKQPSNKRLIEVAEEALINCVFFISKESGRPKIKFSSIDQPDHPLLTLFSMCSNNPAELNYNPLVNNQLYERLITQPFKDCEIEDLDKEALIYITAYKNSENRWLMQSLLDCDFKSIQDKKEFILRSEKKGRFYALHYRLTGVEHVDLNPIKSEIRAISRFATHLTKKLEEELWEINGVIEITDRTAEVIKAAKQIK